MYEWGRTARSADEAAAKGLKRVAADVGSGKLAGVTFFKGADKGLEGEMGGRCASPCPCAARQLTRACCNPAAPSC